MIPERKVAALYCVYSDTLWLPYSYQSVYAAVSKIYFFLSEHAWHGPDEDLTPTLDAIAGLPDPDHKIEMVRGEWREEAQQRNFSIGFAEARGYEWGFLIDTDEIYDQQHLQQTFAYIDSRPEITCWHLAMITYWKSKRYRVDPPEPHHPPVFVKLGAGNIVETRNFSSSKHALIPPEVAYMHHLSYARPDSLIKKKHISFSGHSQSADSGWYERVWKGWDRNPALEDLHPVIKGHYQRAVPVQEQLLPPVLRELALDLPPWRDQS